MSPPDDKMVHGSDDSKAPPVAEVDIPEIIRSIPRHRFVAPELHPEAYRSDDPSLRDWQGLPPDRVITRMIEGLELNGVIPLSELRRLLSEDLLRLD